MIVDSSALVAVVFQDAEHDRLIDTLLAASTPGIGTPTLVEAGIVISARMNADATDLLRQLIEQFGIVEVPFGDRHWREAVHAHRRYGRGRHDARLNFGDCLSYAVASLADEPLLFVGKDFTRTDIATA